MLFERKSKCRKRCKGRNESVGIWCILLSPKRRYCRFSEISKSFNQIKRLLINFTLDPFTVWSRFVFFYSKMFGIFWCSRNVVSKVFGKVANPMTINLTDDTKIYTENMRKSICGITNETNTPTHTHTYKKNCIKVRNCPHLNRKRVWFRFWKVLSLVG